MNIKTFLVVISLIFPAYANAAFVDTGTATGYMEDEGVVISPVAEVFDMWDDSDVVVEGYITEHIHDDQYTFRDNTGSIQVELEHEDFSGLDVSLSTKIRLYGEVDHFFRTSIEASRIIALSE